MINREKRDKEAFLRERTLDSLKENPHLELGDIVYVAEEQSFYSIVDSSSSADNKIILLNDLFAVLQEDPKRYTKTETDSKFTALDNKLVDGLDKKSDKGHKHGNAEITDIDASKITTGIIDIERLPAGALERCIVVDNDTVRLSLTTYQVQLGDTVKVVETNMMYRVIDESKLTSEEGYVIYSAGYAAEVPWAGVTGKPATFIPSNHTQPATTIIEDETHRFVTDADKENWNDKLQSDANAVSATKLETARSIEISGGATGTATDFDGTINVNIPITALDMSAASAGILSVERGGTGNDTNTSATCTGNSATATKLQTAINIGGASFDGSVSLTLEQIGAAASNHTHPYVPLSGGTMTGNLVGEASCNISGFGKVYNAVWNDYAEFFERGEETEPGDIIALDVSSDEERYIKADCKHYDIVGVHSNSFAHLIGGEEPPEGEDYFEHNIKKFIPIGLAGRVMCKVIGPVKKGDYIGVSKIPGVGIANESMTINRIGVIETSVVGMALENKETDGIGLVKILID